MLRNVSETLDDLKDSAVPTESDIEENSERPMTSMSNECLPDPSNIDIPDNIPTENPNVIKHLNEELIVKENELEQKNIAIRALSDQVEQKDNVIREQAENLDEYRMEILHLRGGDNGPAKVPAVEKSSNTLQEVKSQICNTQQLEVSEPGNTESKLMRHGCEARALSEEEDSSWSEPGRYFFKRY